jgi:hypothetical protein
MHDVHEPYRFVYRSPIRDEFDFWLDFLIVFALVVMALWHAALTIHDAVFRLYVLAMVLLIYFHYTRRLLQIDSEGIVLQWQRWPFASTKHLTWREIAHVQWKKIDKSHLNSGMKEFSNILLLDANGKRLCQLDCMRFGVPVYVGAKHSLSLREVIEKFCPVED